MTNRFLYAFLLFLFLLPFETHADTTVKRLAPGITLTQEVDKTTPLIINVLQVDLRAPGVHVGVGIGGDKISGTDPTKGREDVSRYARRHRTLAAVNADFFPFTGDPLGVGIKDGHLFSEPYTGSAKGGPRIALGLVGDGRTAVLDTLGFLGDLQTADNARYFVSGVNRLVGAGEIVAFTPLYGPVTGYRRGGVEVVLGAVSGSVQANTLVTGRVVSIQVGSVLPAFIPDGGIVLSAGPGAGAAFLSAHCHMGETVGFVLAVTPPGQTHDGIKMAALPRTASGLPSRAGEVARGAVLWTNVRQAVGGGPRLLAEGQVAVDGKAEGFDTGFTDHAYPRTAVGISRDGSRLIVVTADGRQTLSRGATLPEMAAILKRYGAWNGMNFDGGGSTSMAVAGVTVNSPEGTGAERPVADMLTIDSDLPGIPMAPEVIAPPEASADPEAQQAGLTDRPVLASPAEAILIVPKMPLLTGTTTALRLLVGGKTLSGADPRVLWQGAANGVGFVTQKGYFLAQKAGTGTLAALYDGRWLTAPVVVQSKTPVPAAATTFALRVALSADRLGASNRSQLFLRVLDRAGAPKAGAVLHLVVTGGSPDLADVRTDPDGGITVGITWDGRAGRVLVTSPGLAPVTVPQAPPGG